MKEIKFTTSYNESTLSFLDENFKKKYKEQVENNSNYTQKINGKQKHLALYPRCNNPVAILGVFKKIDVAPHARHAKGVNIPGIAQFNEYKFQHCPYHRKKANYVKEYVPETDEPQRHELYKIAKEHYDKAIYLLQKETGIYITHAMAEKFAKNYTVERAYNYIDATMYNIPWYLIYSSSGFSLHHMIFKKNTTIYKHLRQLGLELRESNIKGSVYVEDHEGCRIVATNYRYSVDKNDHLNEWLDFSITCPNNSKDDPRPKSILDRFSVKVDSYYFENLIHFKNWKPRQNILDIAAKYMNP